jgi:hypothetical protein
VLAQAGYESHICEKGQAGQPLSAELEASNRKRSRVGKENRRPLRTCSPESDIFS